MKLFRGERLKLALQARDKRQHELAAEMGNYIRANGLDTENTLNPNIGQQQIAKWANGYNTPNSDYLAVICIVLDANPRYLLGLSNELENYEQLNENEIALLKAYNSGDTMTALKLLTNE